MTRFLLALALFALPAQAATLNAKPDTLAAILKAAKPGDRIVLARGSYGDVVFPKADHAEPVVVQASAARAKSLVFRQTAGWAWRGGTIDGVLPPSQYFAVTIDDARRIEVSGATLTGTMVGVTVTRRSSDIDLRGNIATGLQSDGFNVAWSKRVNLIGNVCEDFRPVRAIYDALGKLVRDGTHNDCIQLWSVAGEDPTSDITIVGNLSTAYGQGIGQYWSGGPIRNVVVERNVVRSDTWNALSFSDAEGLVLRNNVVTTVPGSKAPNFPFQPIRSWIYDKLGKAVRCGNVVDGKADQPC